MDGVDNILVKGLKRIHDVIMYYKMELDKLNNTNVDHHYNGRANKEDNEDGEGEDKGESEDKHEKNEDKNGNEDKEGQDQKYQHQPHDTFIENILAVLDRPAFKPKDSASDWLCSMQKWSGLQHSIQWPKISWNEYGTLHTIASRHGMPLESTRPAKTAEMSMLTMHLLTSVHTK